MTNDANHLDTSEIRPDASDAVAGGARTITYVERPRRMTFGGFVTRLLLVTLVAGAAFVGGYFARDRQGFVALQEVMEQRLAAQERVLSVERELMDLQLAQAKEERRRATVVEVNLEDMLVPLRASIAKTAAARFDALAAYLSSDLTRLGQVEQPGQGGLSIDRLGPASEFLANPPAIEFGPVGDADDPSTGSVEIPSGS